MSVQLYWEAEIEIEAAFAAHNFGDSALALEKYELAQHLWVEACLEASDNAEDAPTEVKVYFLNAIGQVHQSAGELEQRSVTLARLVSQTASAGGRQVTQSFVAHPPFLQSVINPKIHYSAHMC